MFNSASWSVSVNPWCCCNTAGWSKDFDTLTQAWEVFTSPVGLGGDNFTVSLQCEGHYFTERHFDSGEYCLQCAALEAESDYLYSPPVPLALARGPHPSGTLASRW